MEDLQTAGALMSILPPSKMTGELARFCEQNRVDIDFNSNVLMHGGISASEQRLKKRKELKLIGEGTYGCVFYPGINCKGTIDTPNYVTKLQKNTNSIKNEWTISQRITKLAGYKQFFAPIIKNVGSV